MKEAYIKYLVQITGQKAACHLMPINAGTVNRGVIVELDAGHILQRQYQRRRVIEVDGRDINAGIVFKDGSKGQGMVGFRQIVQFFPQYAAKFFQQVLDVCSSPDETKTHPY